MEIDKNKIKELVKILDELKLTELSYSDGKHSIKVGKGASVVTGSSTQVSNPASQNKNNQKI